MEKRTFYIQFFIINALSISGIVSSLQISTMAEHYILAWTYFLFFSTFVWLTYHFAMKAANSENKNDFTRLTIALIFLKILFCITITITYTKFFIPTNNYHVIYFLVLYIIYSLFEFRTLTKLSYQK